MEGLMIMVSGFKKCCRRIGLQISAALTAPPRVMYSGHFSHMLEALDQSTHL